MLSDEETVPYILSASFRPSDEVVLTEEPPISLPGGPVGGEVRWLERGLNRMRLQVRSDSPALLVLAENWYPAWKAEVGGVEVPVLRANHTLRAVPVPSGESEVEVFYDAGALLGPFLTTLASLALVSLAVFVRPGRKPGEAEVSERVS